MGGKTNNGNDEGGIKFSGSVKWGVIVSLVATLFGGSAKIYSVGRDVDTLQKDLKFARQDCIAYRLQHARDSEVIARQIARIEANTETIQMLLAELRKSREVK